jgi:uncharacterized ion transporter superfamily protein YfcC
MQKRGLNIDSLVLIFSFIIFAQLLSYVVPQGQFETQPYPDNPERSMVVAGTYELVASNDEITMPPWYFLLAVTKGLADAQDIIFLIFLVGGVIEILRKSGAIDAALHGAVARLGHSPWILIAGCFAMFSVGSFTIGMGEEYVPLIPIIVTMCLAMRMDALVAMGMVWVPYGIGWGCAGINPFGVLIAQNIASVPLTSGAAPRFIMMVLMLAIAFHHVYRYAMRVRRNPSASLVAHVDYGTGFERPDDIHLTRSRIAILLVFLIGLVAFVYGAANLHWYISELNAVFLAIGLIAALIARIPAGETSQAFLEGAAKMAAPALIVGFARTIAIVLSDGQIIDTIVHSIAGLLEGMPPDVSAVGMLVVQSITTAVLAYQFGDGLTNMIIPTNALVVGALALGRVPYAAWVKFIAPLLAKLLMLAVVFMVLSIHIGDAVGFF